MKILGDDYLGRIADTEKFLAKMVFNDQGAYIFSATRQHSEMKTAGISYEHDERGNALAARLKPDLIEIRYDSSFNNDRVTGIMRNILASPQLAVMKGWKVTYRGRPLNV